MVHQNVGKSPFEIVYGLQPIGPLDLTPIVSKQQFNGNIEVRVREITKLHENVRSKIEKMNAKYMKQANRHKKFVEFQVGDLVRVHLSKDHFPLGKYGKLKPRIDGPFKVLERIGENAYKLDILDENDISLMFNVKDLRP